MHVTSEQHLPAGIHERGFSHDDVPGILWTPADASPAAPVPLILLAHLGGLDRMYPRLADRAQVEAAVPEWQALLDSLLALPEMGGPIGISGGVIAIGVRLALVEPRVVAAGLFAGSFVPRTIVEEARRVTIPVHVLLQWDDEGNDRQAALDLFDPFGSAEKTLQANMGGHAGVPAFAGETPPGSSPATSGRAPGHGEHRPAVMTSLNSGELRPVSPGRPAP